MNFIFRGDHMQLPQALVQLKPRIARRQSRWSDGQADRLVFAIESFEPRHASLANFALPVVKHSAGGRSLPLFSTCCCLGQSWRSHSSSRQPCAPQPATSVGLASANHPSHDSSCSAGREPPTVRKKICSSVIFAPEGAPFPDPSANTAAVCASTPARNSSSEPCATNLP